MKLLEKKSLGGKNSKWRSVLASPEKIKWLRETFNGYCTEMEGAAVAHVCHIFELPFLVIRAISDKADDDAKMDYPEFVKLAAKNSKTIIEEF